jgi:hypothetical protein
MSSEARAINTPAEDVATLGRRHAALRLAVGVTCCFVLAEALNWDATFLAPMLAAQFLVKLPRSPTLKQAVGIVVLIAAAMFGVLFASVILVSNPLSFILCLGLLHYLAFYAQLRGAAEFPTLMIQIAGVAMPVFVVVSPALASGLAATLVSAGVVAILTIWAAYAAFPATVGAQETPIASAQELDSPSAAATLALLKTLILMPVLAWFVLDASQTAIVVLIMIVTLLRLVDSHLGWRTAFGLTVANLLGGLVATVAYNVVKAGDSIVTLAVVILCISMVFAGRIVTARDNAPIFVVAFATFILLLGSGLSPLPGGSEEAAITRVMNVVMATAYAAGALSLFQTIRSSRGRAKLSGAR